MLHPDYVLLYVENPLASGDFYADLLGLKPVESAPTFVMFVLPNGIKLGLWLRSDIQPTALPGSSGFELCISQANDQAVHALHAAWLAKGIKIVQEPQKLDFGLNFLATDLDGHRIRVFSPPPR